MHGVQEYTDGQNHAQSDDLNRKALFTAVAAMVEASADESLTALQDRSATCAPELPYNRACGTWLYLAQTSSFNIWAFDVDSVREMFNERVRMARLSMLRSVCSAGAVIMPNGNVSLWAWNPQTDERATTSFGSHELSGEIPGVIAFPLIRGLIVCDYTGEAGNRHLSLPHIIKSDGVSPLITAHSFIHSRAGSDAYIQSATAAMYIALTSSIAQQDRGH
jgi:hypothetical protein